MRQWKCSQYDLSVWDAGRTVLGTRVWVGKLMRKLVLFRMTLW